MANGTRDSSARRETSGVTPELLAPAGDWDCVRAAVANGADAVYFGLNAGFNARARATNFSLDELPQVLQYVHARGVKAYVTLNTLVFPSELERLEAHVRQLAACGVDAVLVQDIGLARLARAIAPDLPLHASTQMTLTSSQSIELARALGIERVVAPRELSLDEIRRVRRECDIPLEVFVHGALCVAYSGQCLTSESLGGRSANRGECAQACRLSYQLVCDGRDVDLGPQKYLLSPQDLAAFEWIPELVAAGVCSLKIEGRLKTPEYVANITSHYRRALDIAAQGQRAAFTADDVEHMELSFSRGFSPGWLLGCDHKRLVPATSSAKRGVALGTVVRVDRGRVFVRLQRHVKRGDGLVFEGDREQGQEQGGRVYEIFQKGKPRTGTANSGVVELTFAYGALDFARIQAGQRVWKTDDPELNRRLRRTFQKDQRGCIGLTLSVHAETDQPLRVRGRSADGKELAYVANERLPEARRQVITSEELTEQLGRLGHTDYELTSLDANIIGRPMVPRSMLGDARRELIQQLTSKPAASAARQRAPTGALQRLRAERRQTSDTKRVQSSPQLHVLCRSLAQIDSVLSATTGVIYADFADIRQYREAVEQVHQAGRAVFLATPRIQKPDEFGLFRAMARHGADGFLVRNLGGVQFCQQNQLAWVGDFSLNATNDLTVDWLLSHGAMRLTPSYDLNRDQLTELTAATDPATLEVVIHQHIPMFHMEHCVYCAVLSPGTNKHNCGRPCDTHQVKLRDRIGMEHPLTADVGCRNTLFNATPQSAAEAVPELSAQGVQHYRVELLETTVEVTRILKLYGDLLAGRIDAPSVWRQLQAHNRVGVTRGTLEERRNPLAIL